MNEVGFWQYMKEHFNFFNDDGYATIFAMLAVMFLSVSRVILALLIKKRVEQNMRAIRVIREMVWDKFHKRDTPKK
jgi:hypothetical protein